MQNEMVASAKTLITVRLLPINIYTIGSPANSTNIL